MMMQQAAKGTVAIKGQMSSPILAKRKQNQVQWDPENLAMYD
jgi:hypothetical protein